jgi:hypothetical protein
LHTQSETRTEQVNTFLIAWLLFIGRCSVGRLRSFMFVLLRLYLNACGHQDRYQSELIYDLTWSHSMDVTFDGRQNLQI